MSIRTDQHWMSPQFAIEIHSLPLGIEAKPFATGWQKALARPAKIEFEPLAWQPAKPDVVSVRVRSPKRPRVSSFCFNDNFSELAAALADPTAAPKRAARPAPTGQTRITPPRNLVKLEDRLRYLLQPSLETMLCDGPLGLPFHPFPYQYEGIAFLYPRYAAVLADEMGLGKTMQAITSIRLLLHAGQITNALLVCPKPLVSNWKREFALWAPEIPLTIVEGNQARREWLWNLPESVVTIANYELVTRDEQLMGGRAQQFDLVVLDEAQRIKNRSGRTAQVVRSISRRRSWALTGTPIENSTEDLVGIFEFVAPGQLAPGMKPRRIARTVHDFILRRCKDQVLKDLPPKLIRDAELALSPEQHDTYKVAEDEGIVRLSNMGEGISVQHVFELILRLKQICNFDPATGESSKLDRLMADLDEIAASGQKAIVFSQWVATLKHLAGKLQAFRPLEYHGSVPTKKRDQVIRKFREDPSSHVILMSYGAGGVGLNLQFAGYVFLFDRWWNPAVEDQAINRAHRIGAAGPVTVTRFLSTGTIEERINQILEEKREIFDTIFQSGQKGPGNLGLTQQEIFGLFDLRVPPARNAA